MVTAHLNGTAGSGFNPLLGVVVRWPT